VPEPTPSRPQADRNLLFGILALQMDFINRDALIQAMHAWVLEKAQPLGQILVDQGALRRHTLPLLEALVQKHLELHGHDAQQSLAALSSLGSVRKEWNRLRDRWPRREMARGRSGSGAGHTQFVGPRPA
jgi:eukaryotic-like serine/threonine-protein kinase